MVTVGSYQAKTHLPRLLGRVVRGERITITRHGRPVAMLVPPETGTARPTKKRRPAGPPGDFAAGIRWLDQHREKYAGQWVALHGGRLLAHGTDAKKVHQAARASGLLPLVAYVEPARQAFWGGW